MPGALLALLACCLAAAGRAARPKTPQARSKALAAASDSVWSELVSWTSELTGGGAAAEEGGGAAASATTSSTTAPPPNAVRLAYIADKLRITRETISQFVGEFDEPGVDRVRPDKPKVAFLVLAKRDVVFPALWDRFFGAAPGDEYSIYVHHTEHVEEVTRLAKWGAVTVPHMHTEWCALLGMEVAMLAEALRDPANTQFVFVSESTVPLKSFGYVYGQLVQRTPFTSKFCLASPADYPTVSRQALQIELTGGCYFRDFYRPFDRRVLKHHQWVVLSRAHAIAVVRHAPAALDVFERAWRAAAPDLRNGGEGCSDESALLTALLLDLELRGDSTNNTWADLTRLGVEQQCLTFVRWRGCLQGTDFETGPVAGFAANVSALWSNTGGAWQLLTSQGFMFNKLKEVINGFPFVFSELPLEYLRKLVRETGFMLGRKFEAGTQVIMPDGTARPLEEVLPPLWHLDGDSRPELQVWSKMETIGKPVSPLDAP